MAKQQPLGSRTSSRLYPGQDQSFLTPKCKPILERRHMLHAASLADTGPETLEDKVNDAQESVSSTAVRRDTSHLPWVSLFRASCYENANKTHHQGPGTYRSFIWLHLKISPCLSENFPMPTRPYCRNRILSKSQTGTKLVRWKN